MVQKYPVQLGNHRGDGCRDHAFYNGQYDIKTSVGENTVPSMVVGLRKGGAYPEIDACQTKEVTGPNKLISIHNVVPTDHFFNPEGNVNAPNNVPPKNLNELPLDKIRQHKTGRHQEGEVALVSEILDTVAEESPRTLPWLINIELKHTAGSKQPYSVDGYFKNLADVVDNSPIKPEEVLYSAFCLENLIQMSHQSPNAHFGMLFREEKPGDADGQPPAIGVYTDHTDDPAYQYLPFSVKSVAFVMREWKNRAHPDAVLGFMHPERKTVTNDMIAKMGEQGLDMNIWTLFEPRPEEDAIADYQRIITECQEQNVSLTIITDYVSDMKAALKL